MNTRIFKISAVIFFSSVLAACAPGLNTTMSVSEIPTTEKAPKNLSGVRVKVDQISDDRSDETVAVVDGRNIRPENDVATSVQQAIERHLKAHGARLGLFNTPLIRGSVQEWKINVYPAFPTSKAEAVASIHLDLMNLEGKKVYGSKYSGNMAIEHPMLTRAKTEEILGAAMQNAIDQALSDSTMVNRLLDLSQSAASESGEEGATE